MELIAIVDDNDGVKGKSILGKKTKDPSEIDSLKADVILVTSILQKERILKDLKKRKNQLKLFTIS